jgi:hypothetical protein
VWTGRPAATGDWAAAKEAFGAEGAIAEVLAAVAKLVEPAEGDAVEKLAATQAAAASVLGAPVILAESAT